jgi:hypothetical protein
MAALMKLLAGPTTGIQRKSVRGDGHERIILRALALVPISAPGVVAVGSARARRMVA